MKLKDFLRRTLRDTRQASEPRIVMPRVTGVVAAGISGMLVVLSFAGVPLAANAAGETLQITLSQTTGTGPFDADDVAGHDSSATNEIVRTNDTMTYKVGVRYEGGDQTNPTLSFTLPKGEQLVSLPPFCLTGSGVTPAVVPDPEVPTTATSWLTLPTQVVSCVVAPQTAGTSLDYTFVSKVRPEVPNGTLLGPIIASATSDQVTTPVVSEPVQHTVSAAADFDVSKRLDSTTDNNGPFFQYYGPCSFDASRSCTIMDFPLTINGPAGGKGISPLASPITITEDLTIDGFFGPGTTTSAAWLAAGPDALDKYAPRLAFCFGGIANLHGALPNHITAGGGTTDNSVRDSGDISCTQSALGTPVDITITDADTTGFTVPSRSQDNLALPANLGLVVSTTVRIQVPLDAVTDLGTTVDGVSNLEWRNTYTQFEAEDITGQPNLGEDPSNNTRVGNTNLRSAGGFDKLFSGVTGEAGNTPTGQMTGDGTGYSAFQFEGPPGSGQTHDGNTVVLPGQTVLTNLYSPLVIPPGTGNQLALSRVVCDVWDDTKLGMPQTFDFDGATSSVIQIPSGGDPAWISGYRHNSLQYDADPAALTNLTIQYSYTPTPGSGSDSDCSTGEWFDSAAAVPGATVVDGIWKGINRVRFSFSATASGASFDQNVEVNASIALTVLSTAGEQGTILPNWASITESRGVLDRDAVLADPTAYEGLSSYVPSANTGGPGDRLIVGQAVARIAKFVRNPGSGEFTDTAVPQYTAGSTVDYRLNPSLTAPSIGSTTASVPVTVEDCLPPYQAFVSSIRESGATIVPSIVQMGAPAGAGVACPADQVYIKWDLGSLPVNQVIDPIIYTVEELATVRNGVYRNTVVVSSPGDPSPVAARTDAAQIQIVVPTGIKIAKSVDKPVVEVTPADAVTPRGFTWTVDFANIDAPQNVSDVDVIDVLPADGLGGNHFAGTLTLTAVTPSAATTGTEILYTSAASAALNVDPDDATNGAVGATVWCDAPSGGNVISGAGTNADCPTSLVDVTGLRFLRDGAFNPTDTMKMTISMEPFGNAAGDVYENRTAGRVTGVSLPVGPAVRQVNVVASEIGDRVWNDINSNGIQDDGEPNVQGMPVTLSGTDVDGNPITATLVTDSIGRYIFQSIPSGTYTITFDMAWAEANGYAFTIKGAGTDTSLDSNADPATGIADPVILGVNEQRLDVDAGLVRVLGGLIIVKDIAGAGATHASGPFDFSVVCALGDETVYDGTVTLERASEATTLTSERIGDIPVGASCLVTETDNGGADETPAPVTVIIVTNDDDNTVTAGFVNEFSAGTISLEKVLAGTGADVDTVKAKIFTIDVTCQVAIDGLDEPVTVLSTSIEITGGDTILLTDVNGDPILLPLGAVCFGDETDDGGAKSSSVDHDSFENGVVVESGTPDDLQALKITATNTFDASVPPKPTGPTSGLAITGADPTWLLILALLLIATGGFVVARRRSRSDRLA